MHKVLECFSMQKGKSVSTPKIDEERAFMGKVPYASAIGSLMYAMVVTRPNIAHVVGVISIFITIYPEPNVR